MVPHKNLTDFRTKHNAQPIREDNVYRTDIDIRDVFSRITGLSASSFILINPVGATTSRPSLDYVIRSPLAVMGASENNLIRGLNNGDKPYTTTSINLGKVYTVYMGRVLVNLLIPDRTLHTQYFQYGLGDILAVIAHANGLNMNPHTLSLEVGDSKLSVTNEWTYIESSIAGQYVELAYRKEDHDRFSRIIKSPFFNSSNFLSETGIPVNEYSAFLGQSAEAFRVFLRNNLANVNSVAFDRAKVISHIKHIVGTNFIKAMDDLIADKELKDSVEAKWLQAYPEAEHTSSVPYLESKKKFIETFKTEADFQRFMLSSLASSIKERIDQFKDTLPKPRVIIPKVEAPIVVEEPSLAGLFPAIKKASKSKKKKAPDNEVSPVESEEAPDVSFALEA